MTIKQINATYLVNEDRILFRFNTQDQAEYRLWFTRRVTLFLLAASSHLLSKKLEQEHSAEAAKALNKFENEAFLEAAKTANAGQNTYESGTQFPIGFDPLLVMDITCALTKNDEILDPKIQSNEHAFHDGLSVDFVLPGGANLNLKLAGNMMRAMCLLLDQLRQQAGWGEATLSTKNVSENKVDGDAILDEKLSQKISIH
ncbi:hypothetical protein [Polynucleobacter sp. MWH-Jannik1A5]|uniref:hypothetical protein n=1 Tax=Polynucleobacter sp. MWH-Jannik1A5 TaxID=1855890 RepID=UPI001C0B9DD3|nr:hypothetical protein [Polynucleobacter sp. MWH-Jannik1A5]MBU3547456.1 hypothetical protein [Polynucleobacter sp. MWH-Jannik1A5]